MAERLSEVREALIRAAASTLTGASQGATMGAYDELAAFLGAPIKGAENVLAGRDGIDGIGDIAPFLGRSFQSALAGQEALNTQAFRDAPAAYVSGDVAGAILAGLGLAKGVANPAIANMLMRGGSEGVMAGSSPHAMVGNGKVMVGH